VTFSCRTCIPPGMSTKLALALLPLLESWNILVKCRAAWL
jgi:hypothetical protein